MIRRRSCWASTLSLSVFPRIERAHLPLDSCSLFVLSSWPRASVSEAMMIYYVALPFVRLENGGLVPGEAVDCPHSSAVIRRADAMYRKDANAGAVALARI